MRYLILSDLHSNWEALQAVVADTAGSYDKALCCGDVVGYGADPNPVSDWVRNSCGLVVRGNHDKACSGQAGLASFSSLARRAAVWTLNDLTPENLAFLRGLPRGPLAEDQFQVLHGSPLDEDQYLMTAGAAGRALGAMQGRLGFFGHTHLQGGFVSNGSGVETIPPASGSQEMKIDPAFFYLINPGSVGQPRDGSPKAAYVVYDSEEGLVTYRRVSYDVRRAQTKIRDAQLPWELADRLSVGW